MSRLWSIECRECGLRAARNKGPGREFCFRVDVAIERCLDVYASHDNWVRFGFPLDCTHDFEPRNEYGKWATPDMWPDGHPKSMVITSELPGGCTAGGESRCG